MSMPWMPFYPADYLKDTGHLTATEHGAYLLLILHYWDKGGLPDNDLMLRRIAKLTTDQWAESREVLAAFFTPDWKHKRVDAEIARARELSEKRALAAQAKGNRSASAEQLQSNSSPRARQKRSTQPAIADTLHTTQEGIGVPYETPIPSDAHVREGARSAMEAPRTFVAFDTPQWSAWGRHRRSEGKSPFAPNSHHEGQNGWWFPSEWPPGAEPLDAGGDPRILALVREHAPEADATRVALVVEQMLRDMKVEPDSERAPDLVKRFCERMAERAGKAA